MEEAFDSAKRWWWAVIFVDAVMIGASYLVAVSPSNYWPASTGLVIATFTMRLLVGDRLGDVYARGEEIRRLHMIADALGRHPRREEALRLDLSASAFTCADSYFASKQPLGTLRLCENIAESSFFTTRNARLSSKLMLALWGLLAGATVYIVWVAAGSVSSEIGSWLRLIPPMAAFLVSGHLLRSALGFRALAAASEGVYSKAVQLCHETHEPDLGEAALLLSGYEWYLARSAPLPGPVHRLLNNRNNRAWKTHGRVRLPSLADPAAARGSSGGD